MSGITAEIVEDTGALEDLEPQWQELWSRLPAPLPFQSPAWLLPWWRHFAPGPLFTLAAWRDARLVGLAPGYLEEGPLGRRILPLGISLSDHLDILVDPACAGEAMAAMVAAAQGRRRSWDLWELEELLPDAAALQLPLPSGWSDTVQAQSPCPLLALRSDPEAGPFGFPRAKRRQLNLARNRAARRGAVRIERAGEEDALPALGHLFRLHRKRWESRRGEGVLAPDAVQGFQAEAVPRLQAAGLLCIYTLAIGGRVVACHYELMQGLRRFIYLTGFDPDYEHESPSVILLAHAIEQAAAEGCREVDFLRGAESYKYEWGAVDRWNRKRSIRHD